MADNTNYSGVTDEEWAQLQTISSRHNMDQGLREERRDNYWFQRAHEDRDYLLGVIDRLRAEVATLEHLRSQGYSYAVAEMEMAYARIRTLTAENTAMRPIVAAVGEHKGFDRYPDDIDYPSTCAFCNETDDNEMTQIDHLDWCPVTQARAYVAAHPAAEDGDA